MKKTSAGDTHDDSHARTNYYRTEHDDSSASTTAAAVASHNDRIPHDDRTDRDLSI